MVLVVKNLPANAGEVGDVGLIPGSGRSPGGGHGKPLQYSCLKNPMNNMKWQKDIAQEDESPRSVGVWYATGEDQRNSSRKNEVAGPK